MDFLFGDNYGLECYYDEQKNLLLINGEFGRKYYIKLDDLESFCFFDEFDNNLLGFYVSISCNSEHKVLLAEYDKKGTDEDWKKDLAVMREFIDKFESFLLSKFK